MKKTIRVSGIVQGAGPNVETGRSLGTTALKSRPKNFVFDCVYS